MGYGEFSPAFVYRVTFWQYQTRSIKHLSTHDEALGMTLFSFLESRKAKVIGNLFDHMELWDIKNT